MAMSYEALGIGPDAGAVYRLMLTDGARRNGELADRLGLPPERIRAALDRLAELGLVRESVEFEGELQLADPRAGLRQLLTVQEEQLRCRQDEFDRSRETVAQLLTAYAMAGPDGQPDTERLTGRDTVVARLDRLATEAQVECLSFQPAARATAATAASRAANAQAMARGMRMRSVYIDGARRDEATMEHARWLTGLGAEIRTAPVLPVRMIVFDRRAALVSVDPHSPGADAVLIQTPGVVSALLALFEAVWATAVPLGDTCPGREDGLTRQEGALLRLLAEGLTDEAVANRLGLSVRTVRRTAAALMTRLGARSRFEAGLRAKEHGWL
ncbi:LuxR C-terminal-related transcriptional regulator [Kitasatospora cinereorecta]